MATNNKKSTSSKKPQVKTSNKKPQVKKPIQAKKKSVTSKKPNTIKVINTVPVETASICNSDIKVLNSSIPSEIKVCECGNSCKCKYGSFFKKNKKEIFVFVVVVALLTLILL